jgi:hypothetical protein
MVMIMAIPKESTSMTLESLEMESFRNLVVEKLSEATKKEVIIKFDNPLGPWNLFVCGELKFVLNSNYSGTSAEDAVSEILPYLDQVSTHS